MGPLAASSQNANRFMDTSLSTIWSDCKSKLSSCPPYFSLKNLFCQRPGGSYYDFIMIILQKVGRDLSPENINISNFKVEN